MYSNTTGLPGPSGGPPWMFGSIPFSSSSPQQSVPPPPPIHFSIRTVPSLPSFSNDSMSSLLSSTMAAVTSHGAPAMMSYHHHRNEWRPLLLVSAPSVAVPPPSSSSQAFASPVSSPTATVTAAARFSKSRHLDTWVSATPIPMTPLAAAAVPIMLPKPEFSYAAAAASLSPLPSPAPALSSSSSPAFLQSSAIHDAKHRAELRQQQRSAAVLHQQELLQQAQTEKQTKRRGSQASRRDLHAVPAGGFAGSAEPTPMSISPPKEEPGVLHHHHLHHHHHHHMHVETSPSAYSAPPPSKPRSRPPPNAMSLRVEPDAAPIVSSMSRLVAPAPSSFPLPAFVDPAYSFHGIRDDAAAAAAVDADIPMASASSRELRELDEALEMFSAAMMDVASDGSNEASPISGSDNDDEEEQEEEEEVKEWGRDHRRARLAMALLSSSAADDLCPDDYEMVGGAAPVSAAAISSSISSFMGVPMQEDGDEDEDASQRRQQQQQMPRSRQAQKRGTHSSSSSSSAADAADAATGTVLRNASLLSTGVKWLESAWRWPKRHEQKASALTKSARTIWQDLCALDKGPGSIKGLDETMCVVCYMALLCNNCPWLPSEFADYVASISLSWPRPFKKGNTWMRMLKAWQTNQQQLQQPEAKRNGTMPVLRLPDLTLQRLLWWFKADEDRKIATRWVTALQKSGYFDIMNCNSAGIANHGSGNSSVSGRGSVGFKKDKSAEADEAEEKAQSGKSKKNARAPRSQNIHFFVRKWLVPALMVLRLMDDTRGTRKPLKDILPKPLDRLMEAYQVKPYVIQQQCSKLLAGIVPQFAAMVQLRKEEVIGGLSGGSL